MNRKNLSYFSLSRSQTQYMGKSVQHDPIQFVKSIDREFSGASDREKCSVAFFLCIGTAKSIMDQLIDAHLSCWNKVAKDFKAFCRNPSDIQQPQDDSTHMSSSSPAMTRQSAPKESNVTTRHFLNSKAPRNGTLQRRCSRCTGPHDASHCHRKRLSCYRCGKVGHIIIECWALPCYRFGKPGHTRRDCVQNKMSNHFNAAASIPRSEMRPQKGRAFSRH